MTPSGWSSDGQFIAYTTRGSNVWILPLFGDRKPFRVRGDSVHRSIGRVLAGWPMDRIHEQRRWTDWTSTCSRFPDRARSLKCRETVGAIRCGERTAGNCSISRPDGTMMSVPIGDGTFIRCRTAAGALSRKRLEPHAQPGLRRDQRRAALPRQRDATEVQRRGAADRRPQLDGGAQQVAIRSTRTDGGRLASLFTRLSGSLRFGASNWSVGSICLKFYVGSSASPVSQAARQDYGAAQAAPFDSCMPRNSRYLRFEVACIGRPRCVLAASKPSGHPRRSWGEP